jgi:hypothetical protein
LASGAKKLAEHAALEAAGVIAKTAEKAFGKQAVEVAAADVARTMPKRVGKAVVRDSRRRVIPPHVGRLPSGRLPANFEWAGKVYQGRGWTAELAEKYPNGVRFSERGFPDFSPYTRETARFEPHFSGVRELDAPRANRMVHLEETPEDWIWHHVEDGKTMQLVPQDLHEAVRHAGGVAVKGK